jgi:hypothetical protein
LIKKFLLIGDLIMARLTDIQISTAKAWLNDIFVLAKETADARATDYGYMQGSGWRKETSAKYAVEIVNELKMRDFKDLNRAFDYFAEQYFGKTILDNNDVVRKKPDQLAKYVAWFCYTYRIYWNDSIRDPEVIKVFKETYLGKALDEYDCFALSTDRKATTGLGGPSSRSAGSASTGSTRTPSTGRIATGTSDYKTSGPQSGNVRDLKGDAGRKHTFMGKVWIIEGISTTASKSIPMAFIRPLDKPGAAGSTNKVFFGTSWKGYKNCVCFFRTETDALDVAEKLRADHKIPAGITEIKVSYKSPDRNGYFTVGTEYGDVEVLARELNESVEEPLTETVEMSEAAKAYMSIPLEEEVYEMTDTITDPETYFKNYRRAND